MELPCGIVLKNRLAKAAMSDSLGDGAGNPTEEQIALYRRWSAGGTALSLIGEVQVDHRYPEKPGNLVLGSGTDMELMARLAGSGSGHDTQNRDAQIWPQLGHAGALAHPPISSPAGPSAMNIDGLRCNALEMSEVEALPAAYARAAAQAQAAGFRGVQVHAGHGFLLSQFLSPLFNHRSDRFGGTIEARCQLLLDIVRSVRASVGPQFAIAVKVNSSDQLTGGLTEDDALIAISMLGDEALDLIDISGGTYFPGAPSSSDRRTSGPYFLHFARRARAVTDIPLMLTGGFKTRDEAADAVLAGATDLVGLARPLVLDPDLPTKWCHPNGGDPDFPTFIEPPTGGITAWYTMRLTAIADGTDDDFAPALEAAIDEYESRDAARIATWNDAFTRR